MHRIGKFAGLLLFVTLLNHAAAAQMTPVGVLGDPEQLIIEGVHAFSSKQIKETLFRDYDVLAAARATAPRDKYLAMLDRMVRAGYHHAGFPDVTASVRVDVKAGKVVVSVKEGPRYLGASACYREQNVLRGATDRPPHKTLSAKRSHK